MDFPVLRLSLFLLHPQKTGKFYQLLYARGAYPNPRIASPIHLAPPALRPSIRDRFRTNPWLSPRFLVNHAPSIYDFGLSSFLSCVVQGSISTQRGISPDLFQEKSSSIGESTINSVRRAFPRNSCERTTHKHTIPPENIYH